MPPPKRARVSQATSPTPPSQPKTPTPIETPVSPSNTEEQLLPDPWTDDEEIGLMKGLISYKPTGIHKHFRILALHQFLLSNGYIHPRNTHTRPAGIWRKLQTLYDLEALDEREDARQLSDLSLESSNSEEDEAEDDVYSEAENKIHREEFSLPDDDEFTELKWRQRFADEEEREGESPALLPELNLAGTPPVRFTPSFSVEPPSEAATPSGRVSGGRARSGTVTRGKGKAAPATVAPPPASTRRSARRQTGSVAEEEEPEPEAEPEGEAVEEEEEQESESEEEEESEDSAPAARATRTSRGRGRGAGRARGRGRGRGK